MHTFQSDDATHVNCAEPGIVRFFNHSCAPNARILAATCKGRVQGFKWMSAAQRAAVNQASITKYILGRAERAAQDGNAE
ncbi:hypothetical protein T484DRAFT_1932020 [Baffinella frigidus]|nr:hypothetical protein T484DRAFT_1932020 [Cryptophyta sp. CCMP2293]